ncbi:B12-binding domain-containing radical SAM protein [Aliikangiella sp. IMCC44359]|uniref:B12-binding domain-containing radical SAM protein n=1 Tax=Aliikangiella sp. IMCC44359 TaxID=3459125 RepID=UPI00403AE206
MTKNIKKKKIVLYNPQAVFYTLPLSLLALGSTLDPERYEIKIIDARLEPDPLALVLKEIEGALCFGVTVLTGAPILDALQVTRAVKSKIPTLTTIWGGWHPSLFPLGPLEETCIDVSVQGQGEKTFQEIVERLSNNQGLEGVEGIAFRQLGLAMRNPARALLPMDDFPEINYELVPVESYFKLKKKRQLDYISSTGCFFRCAFCADPFVYQRKWSAISPEKMSEQLHRLWQRYQFDDVNFQDETFFTYRKRTESIAENLLRLGTKFTWAATLRGDQGSRLSDEHFKLCKQSGLRRVMVGVESGSPEMLKRIAKDVTIEQILNTAEKCIRHKIAAIFPFIIGFPGESDEDVKLSLNMVKQLRNMSPDFETPIFYYKPYPGSSLDIDGHHTNYTPPSNLKEWAQFDFVGSKGPWVRPETYKLVERFKFYNRFSWGQKERRLFSLLNTISRWRCNNDYYRFPIEKIVMDLIAPQQKLS